MRVPGTPRIAGWGWLLPALLLASILPGCTLDDASLTAPEKLLVAEVYLEVGDGPDELTAFLHWTLGEAGNGELESAAISLRGPRGVVVNLSRGARGECLSPEILDDVEGVCFLALEMEEATFLPGDRVEMEISLPGGSALAGGVTLPGDFGFLQPASLEVCALPPRTPLELIWEPAPQAWAYLGETLITGLRGALALQGVEVEGDSLTLQGLSITEADTTLVFPLEFGVFDRFDLDREVALALQEGLPLGATAVVAVAAAERNYVNWVRGGNFNPSGAVRIPSLRGNGVGVLGAVVRRMVRVVGAEPGGGLTSCLSGSSP